MLILEVKPLPDLLLTNNVFCGHDRYLSFILPGPPDPVEVLGNEGVPEPEIM